VARGPPGWNQVWIVEAGSIPRSKARKVRFWTAIHTGKAYTAEGMKFDEIPEPSEEVILSLSNLERIGAIAYGSSWGGAEIFKCVNHTVAGHVLMNAIKRR
jgi:hypothetical protein